MGDEPRRGRRPALRDRAIVALARTLTRSFFRSVEVEGRPPPDGPVILAASHLYGFVDPVVLIARFGVLPRFLAKATLWKVPLAGWLLGFARVIPVHRRMDGEAGGANDSMFSSAVEALRSGGVVAIFPEGTTHDEPTLRPLRTGAARIAIEAAAAGVTDVRIVPVGVSYEDKVAVRGRALVSYGEPIPVAAPAGGDGDDDDEVGHAAVRDLTDRLQRSLNGLTPHFETTEEMLALAAAATVTLTAPDGSRPPLADVSSRARRLARLDPARRDALVDLVARYRMLLGFVDLDDDDVVRTDVLGQLARRLIVLAVLVFLLLPLAVAGLFANLVPLLLVLLAGLVVKAPVSKGTVRLLVAVVTFPAMWLALAWADARSGGFADLARRVTYPVDWFVGDAPSDRQSWQSDLLVLVVTPALLVVALVLLERMRALVIGLVRWKTLLDRRGQLAEVRERRAQVVEMTEAALGRVDPAAGLPSATAPVAAPATPAAPVVGRTEAPAGGEAAPA